MFGKDVTFNFKIEKYETLATKAKREGRIDISLFYCF